MKKVKNSKVRYEERMVFSLKIELNDSYRRRRRRHLESVDNRIRFDDFLCPDGVYYFSNDKRCEYNHIVEDVETIAEYFKFVCNEKNTWMEVSEAKVLGIQEGSIDVILSLMTTVFDVAGGIKNIYDCVEVVKKMLGSHFEDELAKRFGRYFCAEVKVLAPTKNENMSCDNCDFTKIKYKRDAFFYYLLVSNVMLVATIGLLVFKAVSGMYW